LGFFFGGKNFFGVRVAEARLGFQKLKNRLLIKNSERVDRSWPGEAPAKQVYDGKGKYCKGCLLKFDSDQNCQLVQLKPTRKKKKVQKTKAWVSFFN
jgi:hypothetical protein